MGISPQRVVLGLSLGLAGVGLVPTVAFAQHFDVLLASRDDGQLAVVGEAAVFAGAFVTPYHDAQDVVHLPSTNPGFATLNPSFLPDGYGALPATSDLAFSIHSFALNGLPRANVWYWDGVDRGADGDYVSDVAFAPLDSGSAFRVFRGPVQMPFLLSGVADGSDSDQPGFVLAETSSGGGLHIHPGYEVFGPAAAPPDAGVYLVSLRMQIEGLLESDPLYFAFRTSETGAAAADAARRWLNNNSLVTAGSLGDFNLDGVVDAADYTVWRDLAGADFAAGDYEVWRSQFGANDPVDSTPASVPEPSAQVAALLLWLLNTGNTRQMGRCAW